MLTICTAVLALTANHIRRGNAGVQATAERLKRLLEAKDKKQTILDMAAANEIDRALLQLLQQNIDGATAAGQEQAAHVMSKIRDACAKYVIVPDKSASEEARVKRALQEQQQHTQARQQQSQGPDAGGGGGTTPGGVILP